MLVTLTRGPNHAESEGAPFMSPLMSNPSSAVKRRAVFTAFGALSPSGVVDFYERLGRAAVFRNETHNAAGRVSGRGDPLRRAVWASPHGSRPLIPPSSADRRGQGAEDGEHRVEVGQPGAEPVDEVGQGELALDQVLVVLVDVVRQLADQRRVDLLEVRQRLLAVVEDRLVAVLPASSSAIWRARCSRSTGRPRGPVPAAGAGAPGSAAGVRGSATGGSPSGGAGRRGR